MLKLERLKDAIDIVMQMAEDDAVGNNLTNLKDIFESIEYYYTNYNDCVKIVK